MRIAVFHDLPSGGAKRTLFEKVRRLSKKHIINIFVFSTANEEFCDLRPWVNDYRVYPLSGPRLLKSPFGRYNQLSRWFHLQKIKSLSCQIAADIDSGGYDVAWIEPSQWTQAPLILSYLKTPSVYYCHEAPRHLYETDKVSFNSSNRLSWLDKYDPLIKLYRNTARNLDWEATRVANLVLVNSNHSKQSTKHIYNVQAQVCYHGIDSKVFHIKNDCPKQNHILSVGALQPLKGFDFLIESLSLIPSPQRPLVKIIANSVTPGYREFLENLAKEKEVNLLIEIDLPLEALVCQYNKAALLVYVPYNEPFGLVPLEAMACGAPVLGIAEGGVLETVVDGVNGRLLPRDPDQFAVAIQRHLEDPNLGRQLAETGREYVVQNWSWDKAADNMEYYLAQTAAVNLDTTLMPTSKIEQPS